MTHSFTCVNQVHFVLFRKCTNSGGQGSGFLLFQYKTAVKFTNSCSLLWSQDSIVNIQAGDQEIFWFPASIKVSTHCNITAYRNTVSWQCGRDLWPCNVSKVGYVVTLWTYSVHCRYLAVTSKWWYSNGLNVSGHETWHITTVRSSHLLYIHDASGSHNKLGTPWCNAHRILLRHEARDGSSDCNSVSCRQLAMLWHYGTQ
jgi:hypothetical protein